MEEIIELLEAVAVIFIISIIIAVAWMSTYVRSPPNLGLSTTVLLLQQENTNSMSNQLSNNTSDVPNTSSSDRVIVEPEIQGIAVPDTPAQESSDVPIRTQDTTAHSTCNSQSDLTRQNISNKSGKEDSHIEESNEVNDDSSSSNIAVVNASDENQIVPCIESSDNKGNVRKRSVPKHTEAIKLQTNEASTSSANDGIRIRLKYLDDTQRHVRGKLADLVGTFKRENFEAELSTNCAVRLIFNGRLLNHDSSTLGHYGLFDNCVVHCYVGEPQTEVQNQTSNNSVFTESDDIDLSEILSPLLLIVVAFLWYLRYEYSNIFNTSATIILVCLTALLLVSQYALTITFNISLGFNSNSTTDENPQNNPEETNHSVEEAHPTSEDGNSPSTSNNVSSETSDSNDVGDSNVMDRSASNSARSVDSVSDNLKSSSQHDMHNRTVTVL